VTRLVSRDHVSLRVSSLLACFSIYGIFGVYSASGWLHCGVFEQPCLPFPPSHTITTSVGLHHFAITPSFPRIYPVGQGKDLSHRSKVGAGRRSFSPVIHRRVPAPLTRKSCTPLFSYFQRLLISLFPLSAHPVHYPYSAPLFFQHLFVKLPKVFE